MPTPDEWKSASVNQVIQFLLDDMKILIPHGLFHPDVGIILSLFLGYLKKPREQFTAVQLVPLHNEWGKRRSAVLSWFNQPINPTVLHPVFKDNEEVLTLWVEWPAHWRCLHTAILKEDREAKAEQAKVKSGCKCAGKPKPPAYHHWANRIHLLNAISTVLNQVIGPFMNYWKRIPLPAVPLVLDNLKDAIVLPVASAPMTTTTRMTPLTTVSEEPTGASG